MTNQQRSVTEMSYSIALEINHRIKWQGHDEELSK